MPSKRDKFLSTFQFLTIFPTPKFKGNVSPQLEMMPLVGLTLGIILYIAALITSPFHPAITAITVLVLWFVSTGFLHTDGLADLVDGLAASHSDQSRLLEVMKEPHIGSFAVMSLILLVTIKLLLITLLSFQDTWIYLLIIPAWARLGAAWWASSLPALNDGLATWCKGTEKINLTPWFILLLFISLAFQPILLLAPIVLWGWKAFLDKKVGGMNGDCLGAGIEVCEVGLLFLCCLT